MSRCSNVSHSWSQCRQRALGKLIWKDFGRNTKCPLKHQDLELLVQTLELKERKKIHEGQKPKGDPGFQMSENWRHPADKAIARRIQTHFLTLSSMFQSVFIMY